MGWDQADDMQTRTITESASRADHDGQSSGAMAKRTRGNSRFCGVERSVAANPGHRALAMGAEIR
jgi:hypothetical protein